MSLVLLLLGLIAPVDRLAPAECGTAFREIQLPRVRQIDAVRIRLRGNTPGAASRVTVSTARGERALTVSRGGRWGLRFGPALEGAALTVAVEPTGERGACIDEIVLYCGSEEVAIVTP